MQALTVPRQVGFKSFLNITPNVSHGAQPPASSPTRTSMPPPQANAPGTSFTLTFDENPLAEFVELPDEALEGGLWFSNVLCGVLRGALEMVRAAHHRSSHSSIERPGRTGADAGDCNVFVGRPSRRRDYRDPRHTCKIPGGRGARG